MFDIIDRSMLDWLFGRRKEQPPQKPKPSAEQQAEDKWKYDFLIQFLSGPLWKTSLLDFVDYHCVVFDNQEENKFEYTTIHNKFKQLVGNLFDGMIQEVGLDDDKLAELLEKGFQSKHKKVFNQLLLADDFLKFKKLMVNRNKALEAEAIKDLTEKSAVLQKGSKKASSKEEELIKESKRAEQQRRKRELQQEQQLRKVLEMSKLQAEEKEIIKKMEAQVEQNQIRQTQKVQQQTKTIAETEVVSKPNEPLPAKEQPLILPPVRRRKKVEESPKVEEKVEEKKVQEKKEEEKKEEVHQPPPPPPPVVQEKPAQQVEQQSQQQRKRRLLEQRQKIRKRKQEQRKKQMVQQQTKNVPQTHTIVLQEDGIHETQLHAPEEEKKEKVNNEQIERRRELMRKIKNRIVDDF